MTRDELVSNLSAMAVHEREYSLDGIRRSYECTCVIPDDDKWKVCYVERGKPNELAVFDSVEEAYDFVYKTFCKWLGKEPVSLETIK